MLAGILKSSTNTGVDDEIACLFVAPTAITSNAPVVSSDSLNLRRYTSDYYAQRWEIETNIKPTDEVPFHSLLSMQFGNNKPIYIRPPQAYYPEDSTIDSITSTTVKVDVAKGSTSVQLNSVAGVRLGRFINLGADYKIYMVVGINGTTVDIQPPLRKMYTLGTQVKLNKAVTMKGIYDLDVRRGIVYTDGILADPGIVRVIEKLGE